MKTFLLSRRGLARSLVVGAVGLPLAAMARNSWGAENSCAAGQEWERFPSPEAAGFHASGLAAMEQALYVMPTTSLMIVKSGMVA